VNKVISALLLNFSHNKNTLEKKPAKLIDQTNFQGLLLLLKFHVLNLQNMYLQDAIYPPTKMTEPQNSKINFFIAGPGLYKHLKYFCLNRLL
jgi:hypothetical protein